MCGNAVPHLFASVFISRSYHCAGLHFRRRTAGNYAIVKKANKRAVFRLRRSSRCFPRSLCVRTCTRNATVVPAAGAAENVRCHVCVLFLSTLLVLNNAEHIIPITRCEIKWEEDERAMRYIACLLEILSCTESILTRFI